MPDLDLVFGGDLLVSTGGDLVTVDGGDYATQRVLRRLLTNPADYLWHADYGAGLASFIGHPTNIGAIAGISRLQMRLEPIVATSPDPVIIITSLDDGTVTETIQFVSATTGDDLAIQTPLGPPTAGQPGGLGGLIYEATYGTFDFR